MMWKKYMDICVFTEFIFDKTFILISLSILLCVTPPPSSSSRNPFYPNWLISGVCAITHMRTGYSLSHFWKEKLISWNKEPSVFAPALIKLILPLELAHTPRSLTPSSVYYSLYVALITLLVTTWIALLSLFTSPFPFLSTRWLR